MVEFEGGGDERVHVAKEVFQPGCTEGDVVKFPREFFCLLDLEGSAMGSPSGSEESDGTGDELRLDTDGQAAEVEDESQDSVDRCNEELV